MVFIFSVTILAASELHLRKSGLFCAGVFLLLHLLWGVIRPLVELSIDTQASLDMTPGDLLKTVLKLPKPWIWVII